VYIISHSSPQSLPLYLPHSPLHSVPHSLLHSVPHSPLRLLVEEAGLPTPISWFAMPFNVDAQKQNSQLICHYSKEKEKEMAEKDKAEKEKADDNNDDVADDTAETRNSKRVKVARKIFQNDVLRVQTVDKEDVEVTVVSAVDYPTPLLLNRQVEPIVSAPVRMDSSGIIDLTEDSPPSPPTPPPEALDPISVVGEITIFPAWNLNSVNDSKVYKRDKAARKQPYLDLLVAKDLAQQGKATGQQSMHEGGFATVYKLMAGEQVECPLCLEVSDYLSIVIVSSTRCTMISWYSAMMMFSGMYSLDLYDTMDFNSCDNRVPPIPIDIAASCSTNCH
jgi:hypothetical protein